MFVICIVIILLLLDYGTWLLEHMLITGGLTTSARIGIDFDVDKDIQKLMKCFAIAENFLDNIPTLKEVQFHSVFILLFKSSFNLFFFFLGFYSSKN